MMKKLITKYLNNRFSTEYGTFRGFLGTNFYRALYYLGIYKACKKVEWDKVERLVFVCKGNICRSAFAEAVAHSLGIDAISCGLRTDDGKPANKDAVEAAMLKGIDLSKHRTRGLHSDFLKKGDLLVAMEPWQVYLLKEKYGDQYSYTLMGLWNKPVRPYIHDPYSNSSGYFGVCFDYIKYAVLEVSRNMRG